MPERMYAVAIQDGADLFLWIRLRRSADGDVYYTFPSGRAGRGWKKWNPHGSLHKDGRSHHKSYDKKFFAKAGQKPDFAFKGSENFVTRPIAADEPRAFGVHCNRKEFDEVMTIPVELLSPKKYDTQLVVDLTDANGSPSPNASMGKTVCQYKFNDAVPWILVTLSANSSP